MNKRNQHTPRVHRSVIPKDELYTIDITTGKRIAKQVFCKFHNRYEDIRLFYLKSRHHKKHESDVRSMCIEGWDKTRGKIRKDEDKPTGVLDFSFF
jgi:hypothetical protein